MQVITNPILKGFNPDPSIIRVDNDYYIATSTFEWFPGVQIHHSTDLVNWRLISRVLTRKSQLDLLGVPDSCGVWAPCLSYDKGTFYLVYSNVKSFDGVWKDTPNYLVTTQDITGSWSEPIFLNSSGFDGSLFHDTNGRKWYTSMLVDHRKGKFFGGIIVQEFDEKKQCLIGDAVKIFDGTELGFTEGPHLYKKDDYYYLLTAEGGTEYGHAVSIARSKDILGPYEIHPNNPLITSRNNPDHRLQKVGHGDMVRTQNGEWYIVYLVGRPLTKLGRCTLGRETAIEKLVWKQGEWPMLAAGGAEPRLDVDGPGLPLSSTPEISELVDFESEDIDIQFQSLRIPVTESWVSITEKPGFLRIRGGESLSSFHYQSLIARRIQSHQVAVTTCLEFNPSSFQQMAGLVCYYNTAHYHYLCVSSNDLGTEKTLNIISCDKYQVTEPIECMLMGNVKRVYLRFEFQQSEIQFYYALYPENWIKFGPVLDGSILSDDYVRDEENRYRPAFTGSFAGINCIDLTGNQIHADFDWFEYREF